MPKQKVSKKQSINQIWLSFLFMIVIVGNFFSIGVIAHYYESYNVNGEQILFVSDTNTEFEHVNYGATFPANNPSNFTSGYYFNSGSPAFQLLSYEKIPAYLGNNTWGFSVNSSANAAAFARASYMIALPDLPQWLVTNVQVNITCPGDTDQRILLAFISINDPVELNTFLSTRFYDTQHSSVTDLNLNVSVSLLNGLKVKADSQEKTENMLEIVVADSPTGDGMGAFAYQMSVIITGKSTETWSMENALLISTTTWNVFIILVIIYSFDKFDLGGFVKTIRKSRRN